MPTIIDRRGELRLGEERRAQCDFRPATVLNLSLTGARLVLTGPLEEEMFVAFELPGTTIEVPARVVWRQRHGPSTVVGVRFDRLTESETRSLRGHVLGSYYRMNAA